MPQPTRRIPLRFMNRPPSVASVLGNTATWRCACQNPIALTSRSGSASGPTPETAVVCPRCQRVYFVIPQDKSHGPPIEVVQLFGMPVPADAASAAS